VCTGVHVIEIFLPHTDGGFYRFGDLPELIANSRCPDDSTLKPWIKAVLSWLDDGSKEGVFAWQMPPDGVQIEDEQAAIEWPAETIDLTTLPDDRSLCREFVWLWETQRSEPAQHVYLADGSLILIVERDDRKWVRLFEWKDLLTNYENTLKDAVSSGALLVCNHAGLPHSFPHGQALLDSIVHIDTLNEWGGKLPGGQCFRMLRPETEAPPLQPDSTRFLQMFPRLVPSTEWTGGRMADTDLFNLGDAALFAAKHAGTEVTKADFLRAAARGEIRLRGILRQAVAFEPCSPTDTPLAFREGQIPPLPHDACNALSSIGRASWRTLDFFEPVPAFGGELGRFARWRLPAGEPDLETIPDDCRVTGRDVHALADAIRLEQSSDEHLAAQGVGYRFPRLATEVDGKPETVPSIDFTLLASPEQLIKAFGAFTGMDKSWFSNITDKPKLLKARKQEGKGGKSYSLPWFCPFEVMLWLIDEKRKAGKPMSQETGWRMLRQHWPSVYDKNLALSPLED